MSDQNNENVQQWHIKKTEMKKVVRLALKFRDILILKFVKHSIKKNNN
jgi:hypothetical protein